MKGARRYKTPRALKKSVMKKRIVKNITAIICAAFCAVAGFACKREPPQGEWTVYMPDGAPALALAKLMQEDEEEDGICYRVVRADLIASKVTNKEESKNADLCVMPVTAAAKLLGSGERYVMLGAVTHGNLYILSKTQTAISRENISSLVGKKVGVMQMNNVPGLTFKAVLNQYGISWQELTNEGTMSEDKVNLTAISGADAVATTAADYFVIAEPAASAQAKNGFSIVGDLQALYGQGTGYTQAVLVAKRTLVEEEKTRVDAFIEEVEKGAAWLSQATGEELVATVTAHLEDATSATSLKAPLLTQEVLSRCGIWYTPSKDCKEETDALLKNLLTINASATATAEERFYWTE